MDWAFIVKICDTFDTRGEVWTLSFELNIYM